IDLCALDERIGSVDAVDFSPDGAELAFIGRGPGRKGRVAGVIDLASGTLPRLHTGFKGRLQRVAHLGAGAFAVAETPYLAGIRYVDGDGVHEVDTSGTELPGHAPVYGMERVVGDRNLVVCAGDPATETTYKWLCASEGGGPCHDIRFAGRDTGTLAAVAPDGRLVMMLDMGAPAVVDLSGEPGFHPLPGPWRLRRQIDLSCPAAASPSDVVCVGRNGSLHVWHNPLVSTAPPQSAARVWSRWNTPTRISWSTALNAFVAANAERHVDLLDVPAGPGTPLPDELISERIALRGPIGGGYPPPRLSPAGDMTATPGPDGTIDVHLLTTLTLRRFLAGPMGRMTHQELAAGVAVSEHPAVDDGSRTTLALLRTCLEHRFRHDVAIGDAATAAVPADYEIELGQA
ncbi:MAG: hypothetical protein HOU01_00775, partial [Streptomycetaceae bacterium]|nr:hypothetical protein [Streptomycetaceae bacterium]